MQVKVGGQYRTRKGDPALVISEVTPDKFIRQDEKKFVVSVKGKLHWCYANGCYFITYAEHPLDIVEEYVAS
jgi:hypothetical protein